MTEKSELAKEVLAAFCHDGVTAPGDFRRNNFGGYLTCLLWAILTDSLESGHDQVTLFRVFDEELTGDARAFYDRIEKHFPSPSHPVWNHIEIEEVESL